MKISLDLSKYSAFSNQLNLAEFAYLSALASGKPDSLFQLVVELRTQINFDYLVKERFITVTNNDYTKAVCNVDLKNNIKLVEIDSSKILKLFDEYYALFPVFRNTNSRLLRADKKATYNKFVIFCKRNPEYLDVVLEATTKELQRQKITNYQYMHNSSNFISKDNESSLAACCQNVLDLKSKATTTNKSINIMSRIINE